MKTNKLTLLTVATIATATFGIKGVNADESDRGNITENTTITVGAENARAEKEGTIPSEVRTEHEDSQSGEGDPTNTEATRGGDGLPTNFEKSGNVIRINNPEVEVTFPNGNGKYSPFEVEYKNIEFPDNMEIAEGDKVVTELPKEIGLQTSFDFDVYNNSNIVGKASADAQTRIITTTFNNYFTEHPLNKKMSLKFDAKWLDVVKPGKQVTVNFNGTVKTFTIAEEGPLPGDELLSKWGSQNKKDPQIINWTLRLNTARQTLNNAVLSDTWSDNQEFVEGSQNIYFVEDPIKWDGIDHSAKEYLESWNVRADGFDAKFKEFNRIMYIDYQTRLKKAVKDSTDPTNKATLTADDSSSKSTSKVQLVGGRGDASGENKPAPTFEIPKESPKVEIPEFEGGIPGIPEVREKPEYTEPIGTVPGDAPVLDKPEWKGGTVPFNAPKLDKPEWQGGVTPPDAPVLDKPELVIDIPDPKRDEPKPQPKEDKPNTPAPKTNEDPKIEEVKINNRAENHAQNTRNESEETVEAYSAPAVLPNTGSEFGIAISLLGMLGLSLGVAGMAKKEN